MIIKNGSKVKKIYKGTYTVDSLYIGSFPIISSPIASVRTEIVNKFGLEVYDAAVIYVKDNENIAPYVIEDYMIVCSLPLNLPQGITVPERKIVCDKKAYIQTPFVASKYLGYRIRSKSNSIGTNTTIYGGTSDVRLGMSYYNSKKSYVTHYNNTYHVKSNFPDQDVIHTFEHNVDIGTFKVDDVTYETFSWSTNSEGGYICVPTGYIGERPDSDIYFFEFIDNRTKELLGKFIPCKHSVNGNIEAGWLDIVSAEWYGNIYSEGQFVIPDI